MGKGGGADEGGGKGGGADGKLRCVKPRELTEWNKLDFDAELERLDKEVLTSQVSYDMYPPPHMTCILLLI